MSTDLAALPASALPYVQWALGHWQQIPQLGGDVVAVESAAGLDARWAAVKTAGDLLVTILDDFPVVAPPPVTTDAVAAMLAQHGADGANGQIINILIQNLPAILSFITQIIPLFKAGNGQGS